DGIRYWSVTGVQTCALPIFRPADRAVRRLLLLDALELLRVIARLGDEPGVLDRVLGRLHDDVPGGVEAGAAGAPGDLVELARLRSEERRVGKEGRCRGAGEQ